LHLRNFLLERCAYTEILYELGALQMLILIILFKCGEIVISPRVDLISQIEKTCGRM